jgi:hypothetical protein
MARSTTNRRCDVGRMGRVGRLGLITAVNSRRERPQGHRVIWDKNRQQSCSGHSGFSRLVARMHRGDLAGTSRFCAAWCWTLAFRSVLRERIEPGGGPRVQLLPAVNHRALFDGSRSSRVTPVTAQSRCHEPPRPDIIGSTALSAYVLPRRAIPQLMVIAASACTY